MEREKGLAHGRVKNNRRRLSIQGKFLRDQGGTWTNFILWKKAREIRKEKRGGDKKANT